MAVTALIACVYYYLKPHPPRPAPETAARVDATFLDRKMWAFSEFGCIQEPGLGCFTIFFPTIRWADTLRMAGLLRFPVAFVLIEVLFALLPFTARVHMWALSLLLVVGILVFYRQQIRKMFKIPHGTFCTILEDTCMYMFCTCCALVQEARQLEFAYLAKHEAVTHLAPQPERMHRPTG